MKCLSILCVVAALLFTACRHTCRQDEVRSAMGTWYKKKILFPADWKLLNGPEVDRRFAFDVYNPKKGFFVLHWLMADCDKCIYDLLKARDMIARKSAASPDLKYVFIASGATNAYVKEAIEKSHFQYPVYFENRFNEFKDVNKFPPEDNMYNTMLLDRQDEVILFGAYYDNDEARKIFDDIIKCNND